MAQGVEVLAKKADNLSSIIFTQTEMDVHM